MKRFLLWSFERGSPQYDVICVIILSFIFLTPSSVFNDRPQYMRCNGEEICKTRDDNGGTVYTVQVDMPIFASDERWRNAANEKLGRFLQGAYTVVKTQPIYDTTGMPRAYAFWIDR